MGDDSKRHEYRVWLAGKEETAKVLSLYSRKDAIESFMTDRDLSEVDDFGDELHDVCVSKDGGDVETFEVHVEIVPHVTMWRKRNGG